MNLLQNFLFPVPTLPVQLYFKGSGDLGRDAEGGEFILVREGGTLSSDTFFGSFYRSYWWQYTGLRDFSLLVDIEGSAKLRVIESVGEQAECIASVDIDARDSGRRQVHLPPGSLDPSAGSRLYVELQAVGECRVRALDYATASEPQRQARLSIGLCTFNREERLAKTLASLARLAASEEAVTTVYVVNQGAEFESDIVRGILDSPKFETIRQRNLGGAGGFTRTMFEALNSPAPASHHLLMDDDIFLDERVIQRVLRFLDHAEEDVAVGGTMLDELYPSRIHEAGAFLTPENRIQAYCQNVDLAKDGEQRHFDVPVETDFNAWWFCALPLKKCQDVGFPLPLFIRGDDFEYGQRLADAGVPTVTLPGVAVWHEPFYAKFSRWHSYYDLRNRLIFGATNAGKVKQLTVPYVIWTITVAVLTHDYQLARMRIKAVEDYLIGPRALFCQDPEAIQESVLSLLREEPAPQELEARDLDGHPLKADGRVQRPRMRELLWEHVMSMLRTGLGPLHEDPGILLTSASAHPANTAGRSYVYTNEVRGFYFHMVPRRGRMWTLLMRAALTGARYRVSRGRAGRDWAGSISRFTDEAWWRGLFRLS